MAEEGRSHSRQVPEIRKDTINNRWVIFSPARSRRPSDFKSKQTSDSNNTNGDSLNCPFCIGREHHCAPEIFRLPPASNDWKIRVIQNLYPALTRELPPLHHPLENNDRTLVVSGFGFHDVVIESPVHSVHLSDLPPVEVGDVLLAYKKRTEQLHANQAIQYVQVFKNHGASAGASLSHSHSQIIALPVVPTAVTTRINCMKEYFEQNGKCRLCEVLTVDFIVDESIHFISVIPFAATFPFEIWIIPRHHSSHFHELNREKAIDLGGLLKLLLRKISLQLDNPPFNFMIHTSPPQIKPSSLPFVHWYLQIVPQLTTVGGFEAGSGCYINPIFPEDAAQILKELSISD